MRRKWLALAAVAMVLTAGCSSSHKGATPTTPSTPTAPAAPTTQAAVPASSPPTPAATTTLAAAPSTTATTAPSGPRPCATANLAGTLGASNGAAGTIYYPLVLRNAGTSTCTLFGYPGVSFVTGPSGGQVGAPAARNGGTASTVTLAPGQSAQATLGIADAANFASSCQITPVNGLRVYPPGQTAALFIPHADQACANTNDVTLRVGPLTAG